MPRLPMCCVFPRHDKTHSQEGSPFQGGKTRQDTHIGRHWFYMLGTLREISVIIRTRAATKTMPWRPTRNGAESVVRTWMTEPLSRRHVVLYTSSDKDFVNCVIWAEDDGPDEVARPAKRSRSA
jgi:hypothetical protein